MQRNHMIGCLAVAAIVALALFAFGSPVGIFAFVVICPLMMVVMMYFMTNAMRPRDRSAPKR